MTSKKFSKKSKNLITVLLCLFLSVGLTIIVCSLMNGKTTTTGSNPDDIKTSLLSCLADNFNYPLLKTVSANSRSTKITVIFGQDDIQTISLIENLYYNSEADVSQGEAFSHSAMNTSFSADGLGPDALNVSYAKLSDRMQMSLYADGDELNDVTARYFLLNTQNSIPQTITETQNLYEAQGFSCTVK